MSQSPEPAVLDGQLEIDVPPQPAEPADPLAGPGQARHTDPATSKIAAQFVAARASSARVRLLKAHYRRWTLSRIDDSGPWFGLTDEEAAIAATVPPTSEYATRCSELVRAGFLTDTTVTKIGAAGTPRVVRQITAEGIAAMRLRLAERGEEA